MILEYAQLLSTAHRIIDGYKFTGKSPSGRSATYWCIDDHRDTVLYRATHFNHPSAVWTRQSAKHYSWLYTMWKELLDVYTARYGKIHATARLTDVLKPLPLNIQDNGFTDPPPAMPDYCKIPGDVIASYRNYYIKEKSRFAKWKNSEPEWFTKGLENANV